MNLLELCCPYWKLRTMTTRFRDKRFMMKTIFEEKFDEGKAVGVAEGEAKALAEKAETLLTFFRAR